MTEQRKKKRSAKLMQSSRVSWRLYKKVMGREKKTKLPQLLLLLLTVLITAVSKLAAQQSFHKVVVNLLVASPSKKWID